MKRLRVCLDLDGTAIGHRYTRGGISASVRPGMLSFLRALVVRKHRIVLWTAASAVWVDGVRRAFPELFELISEIHVRETLPAFSGGVYFKDIRRVRCDALIDDTPEFKKHARRLGMGQRYFHLPTYEPHGPHDRRLLGRVLAAIDRLALEKVEKGSKTA